MSPVRRATLIALAASLIVLLTKLTGFFVTGSVALLSDGAESLVNVAAAATLIYAVRLARRPPDYEHPYGHAKAEYLSGAFEGSLILVAAGVILATAVPRLFDPPRLESISAGIALVVAASIVNAATAWYLRRVTARHHSPALEATSRHLMTDIWTSTAVVASVVLVSLTGFELLDPMIGVVAGLHITREGWRVTTGAMSSLLDVRLPEEEEAALMDVLREEPRVLGFHRLRSRRAGINRFLEVDIFVDPRLDVRGAHDIATALEDRIARLLPNLTATLHIEPYLEGTRDVTLTPREEFQPDGG